MMSGAGCASVLLVPDLVEDRRDFEVTFAADVADELHAVSCGVWEILHNVPTLLSNDAIGR